MALLTHLVVGGILAKSCQDDLSGVHFVEFDGQGPFSMGSKKARNTMQSQNISSSLMHHYLLLSRDLLYTGLTRARQLAILVGPPRAIGLAVIRMLDRQRYTALA